MFLAASHHLRIGGVRQQVVVAGSNSGAANLRTTFQSKSFRAGVCACVCVFGENDHITLFYCVRVIVCDYMRIND